MNIAVGSVNRGKSKSVELSLAALGLRSAKCSSISDALLRKLLLGAMPWCYDDPDNADQLQKILLSVFGGCTMGNITNHGASRITPIATANYFILDELAARDDRYDVLEYRQLTVTSLGVGGCINISTVCNKI